MMMMMMSTRPLVGPNMHGPGRGRDGLATSAVPHALDATESGQLPTFHMLCLFICFPPPSYDLGFLAHADSFFQVHVVAAKVSRRFIMNYRVSRSWLDALDLTESCVPPDDTLVTDSSSPSSEYGYSCRYNREVRKRGRQPAGATASNANAARGEQYPRRQSDDGAPRSPSSGSMVSPDVAPGAHFPFSNPVNGSDEPLRAANGTGAPYDAPREKEPARSHFPAPVSVASLMQNDLQPTPGVDPLREPRVLAGSTSSVGLDGVAVESPVGVSDESTTYASPANGSALFDARQPRHKRRSLQLGPANERDRGSFSTTATGPDRFAADFLHRAPTDDCHYRFLDPVLPYIRSIVPASVACDLLDIFLTDPGSSLFRPASPYILTRIFRKKSILHRTNPRPTTPALLATILWCVSQTADIMLLHVPGTRAKIVNDLYDLATSLVTERDPDRWRRIHGKVQRGALRREPC